ncbi:MAG: hypothetical protein A3F84_10870 [Candidatus Handelsmanbacteria bacterium RIFCSPLOWO2_12_FULL_64_10]|uniref:3-keto-alpha-glucoside-1,2-lyase/3-keto-2-hydroxy-glucal hydratase domain-containing protein n=1 Tax=Handelsmanbacteria sp. (strain RIFCSPLOWO2_12_FULL_64_10) TaxID=1817868 RepID=A0A1F6D6E6_HANXR|nr:MAG: hypothetical protein A3F84_10870 [Candidatus Handelsmanbacteria bacterium RIFCSPLOWO2_12_FULL_64_10]
MDQKSQTPSVVGYDDTPMLPGSTWRVHDGRRPQSRVVTPGVESSQERAGQPPSDAVVLFDGRDLSAWAGRDGEAKWKVENGYVEVARTGNIQTKERFGDCQLHIEWAAPAEVKGDGQGRGNSGVFLMGRYEIQVLDGHDNRTYADGITAAIYGQFPPLVNACRRPGEWQTYDVFFLAPRFDGQRLVRPAYMTIVHNGVLVHLHRTLMGATGHKNVLGYTPHDLWGPLMLQDHGNPVRYRNIWIRPIEGYDEV